MTTMENTFKKQTLARQQTVGEILREARLNAGLSIQDIADETSVSAKYIRALEEGRYNDLPSPVYIKNYLQRICEVLGIAWEVIGSLYEKEVQVYTDVPKARHESSARRVRGRGRRRSRSSGGRSVHGQRAILVSRWFGVGAIAIVVLLLLVYFLVQITELLGAPELIVSDPVEDISVTERSYDVRGQTEPEAIVTINQQPVGLSQDGSFEVEVFLKPGLNAIRITTASKRGAERSIERFIVYDDGSGADATDE